MRVVTVIATRDEVRNISTVLRTLDAGSDELPADMTILHVDSGSMDGTAEAAQQVDLRSRFSQIRLDTPGKGRAMTAGSLWAIGAEADCVLFMDGDVQSSSGGWLSRIAGPIIRGESEVVMPSYARSIYDGAVTIHVARLAQAAALGFSTEQPIGGEFGIRADLLESIILKRRPSAANGYGIDYWLMTQALMQAERFSIAELGEKRHGSSLPKLRRICVDVLQACLSVGAREREPTFPYPPRFLQGSTPRFTRAWLTSELAAAKDRALATGAAKRQIGSARSLWLEAFTTSLKSPPILDNWKRRRAGELSVPLWWRILDSWRIALDEGESAFIEDVLAMQEDFASQFA